MFRAEQAQGLPVRGQSQTTARKTKTSPSFKGVGSLANGFFSLIQTHEVAGPTVVNITSMVVPRTAVDLTRNKDAGIETARREITSLVSSSLMPGFYALGIGALLGMYKNKLGVTSQLMVSNDAVDMYKSFWNKAAGNESNFVRNVLNASGFTTEQADEVAKKFEEAKQRLSADKKLSKGRELKPVIEKAVELACAEKEIAVVSGVKKIKTSMKKLIHDLYDLPKELFLKYDKDTINAAIDKFKSLNKYKGILGFSLAAGIAVSTQFINRYITRQQTGSDAFVGLPDYEKLAAKHLKPEKQQPEWQLAAEKAASVTAMAYMLGATYAGSLNPTKIWDFIKKPANIFEKLKFKGKFVALNQLRALSAITISGRILASADINELRETDARDFLGFLNWLVLGDFVAKLTGNALDKRTLNLNKGPDIKSQDWLQKISNIIHEKTSLKTDREINAMKGITEQAKKQLRKNKNIAIGAGLLYSISLLGLGVPIFNKLVTNKLLAHKPPKGETVYKKAQINKKATFNKNMLLVEEALGKLNSRNASSAFFYSVKTQDPFEKFSSKLV